MRIQLGALGETMAKHHHQRKIGKKSGRSKATRKYRRRAKKELRLKISKRRAKRKKRNIGATATMAE